MTNSLSKNNQAQWLEFLWSILLTLSVVTYSLLPYVKPMTLTSWIFFDHQSSLSINGILLFLHAFRVPCFFLVSGWLGALVFEKMGMKKMFNFQVKRLLILYTFLWAIVISLTGLITVFAFKQKMHLDFQEVVNYLATYKKESLSLNLAHFWLIYYLMIYNLITLSLIYIHRQLPQVLKNGINRMVVFLFTSDFTIPFFILLYLIATSTMKDGYVQVPVQFAIQFKVLFAYGLFFSFGWAIHHDQKWLENLHRKFWVYLILGLSFTPIYLTSVKVLHDQPSLRAGAYISYLFSHSVMAWGISLGLIGMFYHFFKISRSHSNPFLLHFSRASYWIFLFSLPCSLFLHGCFSFLQAPPYLKGPLILFLNFGILLLLYQLLIRSTFIGRKFRLDLFDDQWKSD